MKLAGFPARAVRGIFSLLVRINPFGWIDTYLLRHTPIVWRTQFFLVSSYGLLIFLLLWAWGRYSSYQTIADVPTEWSLTSFGWVTLLTTLVMLAPWVYRNLQTQVERARPRDILLLLAAYCACFYSLSLVPTANTYGTFQALAHVSDSTLTTRRAPVHMTDSRSIETIRGDLAKLGGYIANPRFSYSADGPEWYSLNTSESVLYFYGEETQFVRPVFVGLSPIYAHYGYRMCLRFDRMERRAAPADPPAGGAGPPIGTPLCDARAIASALGSMDSNGGSDLKVALKTEAVPGRAEMSIKELHARLDMIMRAHDPGTALAHWYQPLSIGRIVGVTVLALMATWLSSRGQLGPSGRLLGRGLRRRRSTSAGSARSMGSINRFRLSPSKSFTLKQVFFPHYLIGISLFLIGFLSLSVIISASTVYRASTFEPMLVFDYGLYFIGIGGFVCLVVWGIWRFSHAYTLYTVEDLLRFGVAVYRPMLIIALMTTIVAIASYGLVTSGINALKKSFDVGGDIAGALYATIAGMIAMLLLTIESIWLVKIMASSRAARLLSSPVIRRVAVVGYIVLMLIVSYGLIMAATAAIQSEWFSRLFYSRGVRDEHLWVQLTVAGGLLIMLGGVTWAFSSLSTGRSGLIVEKFLLSELVIAQLASIFWICVLLIRTGAGRDMMDVYDPTPFVLFIAGLACWFLPTARLTIRPFFERWARAIQAPANV